MSKVCPLLTLLFIFPFFVFAQSRPITGTVTDDKGNPVDAVSVMVKNTMNGTRTDVNGKFKLNVAGSGKITLEFTHTSYKKISVSTDGSQPVTIQLEKEDNSLDDVVVIGYGKAKKRDLTGAVGIVTGKDLAKTPVANAAEALTGKVAGLQVITTEGSPDAEIKVLLRGGTSISQDNSPLYIVDGFPVSSIANIPMSNIETIAFLKDAATTAIYGSRAANGVFQITTKEGKAGKIVVSANSYVGFRKVTKELNVLDPYQYVLYQYELDPGTGTSFENYYGSYKDLDIYKSVKGRDWQKEVFGRTAHQQYYNVGLSGGSKTARFNLNLTRNKEESVMIGSGYERNNIDFKLNGEISPKLTFDFNPRVSYTLIDGAGVNIGAGSTTRLRNSVKYAPTKGLSEFDQGVVDDDNTVTAETLSLLYDPVASANDEYKKQHRLNSVFNGGLTWKITDHISFRSEGGYEFNNERTDNVWGPATANAQQYAGQPIGNITTLTGYSYRLSDYVTVDLPKFLHNQALNVVVGHEVLSNGYKTVTDESRFFPQAMKASEVLALMNLGTPIPTYTYIAADDRMNSYFGRINYTLNNKYLFTATMRADGSSKFAQGHQWGYFPSAAVAWKISEEDFMQSQASWLNQLKLRASYGTTGNNRIKPGQWKASYSTANDNKPIYIGETETRNLIPSDFLYNPLLKWETTIIRNIGADFGIFNNRISGSIEAYWNTTKDLLIQAPISPVSGSVYQYQNFGSTSNRGIELNLSGSIVNTKDFSLSASFNIGFNKNNVDEYRDGSVNYKKYSSGWNGSGSGVQPSGDYMVQQGQPLGQMYGYVTDGMYTFDDFDFNNNTKNWALKSNVANNQDIIGAKYFGPGSLKFKDISGPDGKPDGKIDDNDKTVIGHANPKHVGGFNLNARYKGFDFGAFFNWTYGNNIYNANKIDYSTYLLTRKYQNILADFDLNHRFTIIDPVTGNNVATGANADPARLMAINENATIWSPLMTVTPLHSWAIEDGSFLRLNTLTIGYTIPKSLLKRAGINTLRVYATAYNLYTWTSYSGFDPEVDTRRTPPVTPGVDYSAYPKSRSFVGGINLTF